MTNRQRPPDYLPHDVLSRQDFAETSARRDLGAMFRIAVKWGGAGFTPSHLARRCEMSVGRVRDYMKDCKHAQSLDVFERVADALHIPGPMLGIGDRSWERRNVNGQGFLTADDEERLHRAAKAPRLRDPGMIDALSEVLAGQRRAEDIIGSASLIEPVKAQLVVVKELVTEARGDLRIGMLDVGSQWAQFSGWLHANTGRLREANSLYGLALEWATEADSADMMATALNMQGHAAWLAGKVGPIIGLSAAAQRYKQASPGVRALAVQQEARGMALSGETSIDDLDRKFDEATTLAAQAAEQPDAEPPWIYFFSPEYLLMQRGLAYRLAGYDTRASWLLAKGLATLPAETRKSEWAALYLLELARTHAKSGDFNQACKLASEASSIAQQTESTRLIRDLARFHARMAEMRPDNPDVIELGESIR